MVIGILLVLVLIRLIFGKNDFTSELIRGISKKLGKKVLIFGVVGGVALLIFIQMEKKSHEAYRESIQEQQQYDIEQYEKNEAEQFRRAVDPVTAKFGKKWILVEAEEDQDFESGPVTSLDEIKDYSVEFSIINEWEGEILISYLKDGEQKNQTYAINYDTEGMESNPVGMSADIGGNGTDLEIKSPRSSARIAECPECKRFLFSVFDDTLTEETPFVSGLYQPSE